VRAGEVEVVLLVDTVGVLGPYAELFPGVPAAEWAPWRERHPELFDGDSWRLPFGSFLLRAPGETVLVDTGVGPAGGGAWMPETWMPEREARLLDELGRLGAPPEEVDVVFNTHIHVDHVGWNDAFPNARLVLHRASWELAHERADRDFVQRCLIGLADRVETIAGKSELAAGVVAFETPGHLPGHMSLQVGDELVVLGDVAPHPAQLEDPTRTFLHDDDPELAVRTRREVLSAYCDGMIACGHYPGGGFGRLANGVWTPLE
jgi:glyoxylase-like metal-dependent hydrolase (beta-lactamase superfamily II)